MIVDAAAKIQGTVVAQPNTKAEARGHGSCMVVSVDGVDSWGRRGPLDDGPHRNRRVKQAMAGLGLSRRLGQSPPNAAAWPGGRCQCLP